MPKLSFLGAKNILHFAWNSSPAFTGPTVVSRRLQSKNREWIMGTVQTKGS